MRIICKGRVIQLILAVIDQFIDYQLFSKVFDNIIASSFSNNFLPYNLYGQHVFTTQQSTMTNHTVYANVCSEGFQIDSKKKHWKFAVDTIEYNSLVSVLEFTTRINS